MTTQQLEKTLEDLLSRDSSLSAGSEEASFQTAPSRQCLESAHTHKPRFEAVNVALDQAPFQATEGNDHGARSTLSKTPSLKDSVFSGISFGPAGRRHAGGGRHQSESEGFGPVYIGANYIHSQTSSSCDAWPLSFVTGLSRPDKATSQDQRPPPQTTADEATLDDQDPDSELNASHAAITMSERKRIADINSIYCRSQSLTSSGVVSTLPSTASPRYIATAHVEDSENSSDFAFDVDEAALLPSGPASLASFSSANSAWQDIVMPSQSATSTLRKADTKSHTSSPSTQTPAKSVTLAASLCILLDPLTRVKQR